MKVNVESEAILDVNNMIGSQDKSLDVSQVCMLARKQDKTEIMSS